MHALPLAQGIIGFIREDFQISFLFLSLYCSTLHVFFPTFVYIVLTYLLPFLLFRGTLFKNKICSIQMPFKIFCSLSISNHIIICSITDHCFWTGLLTKIPSVILAMWLRLFCDAAKPGVDFWTKIFYNLKYSG